MRQLINLETEAPDFAIFTFFGEQQLSLDQFVYHWGGTDRSFAVLAVKGGLFSSYSFAFKERKKFEMGLKAPLGWNSEISQILT